MADKYIPQEIEPKWQEQWQADKLYRSVIDHSRKKFYALTMLPYPSGDLHIGHWYAMTPSDARARFKRMQGYNVMFPMGFDAFGLPAENAAISRGIHPSKWTYANIENMRRQLRSMGAMFDWEREAVSSDPEYYKWTEWFFVQFFKHGLAYKKMSPVDFCPQCNTTLAREQVWGDDRHCERCRTPVIKKDLDQWFFRITKYADELLDFSKIDWPERVRALQTNWIGRSEGAEVTFQSEQEDPITVFTTRPDTLWGATFMVLAPEHSLVEKLTAPDCRAAVQEYVFQARRQTDIERESTEKEKTGVFIGAYAINPVNNARIPIWIADYVLMTYGTGAIMAVPSHDERDLAFAIKYGLPVIPVIDRNDGVAKSLAQQDWVRDGFAAALQAAGVTFAQDGNHINVTLRGDEQIDRYIEIVKSHLLPDEWIEVVGARWVFVFADEDGVEVVPFDSVEADQVILTHCKQLDPNVRDPQGAFGSKRTVMEMLWSAEFYRDVLFHTEYGAMIHSGPFTGTPGDKAKAAVTQWLEQNGAGKYAVTYRLRDWLISRQRYWGAPIPIIYCPDHGAVAVPEDQLPVLLPEDVEWKPTGESPLKLHPTWAHTTCPVCGKPALRETDTMDTFMCSSWYHLRYLSPKYDKGPWDPEEAAYWLPVDCYTGGAEHATMHLIYTRFFTKVLRDIGLFLHDEPMTQLRNQGQILGPDGQRMSKSRGNVIDPDEQVRTYGADTVRVYLMFGYRWAEGGLWDPQGIQGVVRWLHRVWSLMVDEERREKSEERNENAERELRRATHKTIKRVTHDFEMFEFNTIVSALMEFSNTLVKAKETPLYKTAAWDEAIRSFLLMLAPVTPHLAEELWTRSGCPYSVHLQAWPAYDEAAAADEVITLAVQVNGKVRDRIQVPADASEETVRQAALAAAGAQKYTEGKQVVKVIYAPKQLVNIVVK
jgi:leucyl-tRNA synthetase